MMLARMSDLIADIADSLEVGTWDAEQLLDSLMEPDDDFSKDLD